LRSANRRDWTSDRLDWPRFNVDALLHEGAEREPETVEDGEVVGDRDAVRAVLDVPLERTEATDEEQYHADTDVREHDTHPHLHHAQQTTFIDRIGRVNYLIYVSMRHYVLTTSGDIVVCFHAAVCLSC